MLSHSTPREAYRKTHFEARIESGSANELVLICLDEVIGQLSALERAESNGDVAARSDPISRAVTALITLELGVDRDSEVGPALLKFYGGVKAFLLDSIRSADRERLSELRGDFVEIRQALAAVRSGEDR